MKAASFNIFVTFYLVCLAVGSLGISRKGYAYPVRLMHLQRTEKRQGIEKKQGIEIKQAWQKQVFIIGDRHCVKTEQSSQGKASLVLMNRFFHESHAGFPSDKTVPLLWESHLPTPADLGPEPQLYINRKVLALNTQKSKYPHYDLQASDSLRQSSPILRAFMRDCLYRPAFAQRSLEQKPLRLQLQAEINRLLIPKGENILEQKLTQSKGSIPAKLWEALAQNLLCYRQHMEAFSAGLNFDPRTLALNAISKEQLLILASSTADLEFLVNIMAQKEACVVVYTGDGHAKRLQSFLLKVAFTEKLHIAKTQHLNKSDFNCFAAQLNGALPSSQEK